MDSYLWTRTWTAMKVGALTAGAVAWSAARASRAYQLRHLTVPVSGRALRSIAAPGSDAQVPRFGVAGTPQFPGLRVLHLSDTHFYRGREDLVGWLRELAKRAGTDFDLVVLTGDMLSSSYGDEFLAAPALQPFIDSGVPGAYVFGDHDFYASRVGNPLKYLWSTSESSGSGSAGAKRIGEPGQSNRLSQLLADSGWLDLNNANGSLDVRGVRLEFSGVNDPHGHRDQYVGFDSDGVGEPRQAGVGAGETREAEVTGIGGPGKTEVISAGGRHQGGASAGEIGFSNEYLRATGRSVRLGLSHAPYARVLNQFLSDGTDLVFCGHTHGGQVCLPGGHALVTNCDLDPQFASGLFEWQADTCPAIDSETGEPDRASMSVCVSPGLGTSPFTPWRVFCPPAAYIVELVAA
ncbi:metallophosphoesterase [uncultured Mobiluncus sp.]|mgnify:CR=1 FL=1|uniref:metallophosphoesterase n=1 Tax=uncultured Mobiluncus sp. TaxID=293425 RepID=UPI002623CE24|nr:metallophosphoesterase [uncultured Mobiluncus sp.]